MGVTKPVPSTCLPATRERVIRLYEEKVRRGDILPELRNMQKSFTTKMYVPQFRQDISTPDLLLIQSDNSLTSGWQTCEWHRFGDHGPWRASNTALENRDLRDAEARALPDGGMHHFGTFFQLGLQELSDLNLFNSGLHGRTQLIFVYLLLLSKRWARLSDSMGDSSSLVSGGHFNCRCQHIITLISIVCSHSPLRSLCTKILVSLTST